MNKVIVASVTTILIVVFGVVYFSSTQTPPKLPSASKSPTLMTPEPSVTAMTHIEASFAIFTHGTFRVFTAPMYHELSEEVYIEASNPNIVRVKKAGVTWSDFFSTLPFKLTATCLTTGTKETFCSGGRGTLRFYINGVQNDQALGQEIRAGDKLLVTFGTESAAQITQQIESVPSVQTMTLP